MKPIKRSEQLAPLSREHHESLLFAWKIKQGLRNHVPARQIGSYVRWYWNNFLEPHFQLEENLLLPYLPMKDEMAQRLKKDHAGIKAMISGHLGIDSLELLADTVHDHVRFEERMLFPHIEQSLSLEQLVCIYKQIGEQTLHCDKKWSNEFWVNKKEPA